jgi:hypothetical protein
MSDRQTAMPGRPGFDSAMAGKCAECDGGGLLAGGRAVRQEFAGTLTGDYVDYGEPAWRWYLMINLVRKPDGYPTDRVWCESESVFLIEERAS